MNLALGTAQFGFDYGIANKTGRIDINEATEILAEASKQGINTLDTAIAYGQSEHTLGKIGVTNWQLISKLPTLPPQCSNITEWVEKEVRDSIQRLGVKNLYAVLLHNPNQLFEPCRPQILAALESIKKLGLTKKIGASIYSPDELQPLLEVANFDLIQSPLNILDRRLIYSGWAQKLKARNIELHTRSAFLQGLLLMPREQRPQKFSPWNSIWTEWERWLRQTKISPLEACIRYVRSVDLIDKIVIGVDSLAQLREILNISAIPLPNTPDWREPIDYKLITPSLWNTW